MTAKLTSRERFRRMYEHRDADRVPIIDSPWEGTLLRWRSEGLGDCDWVEYFDIDRIAHVGVDSSPRYPAATVSIDERFHTYTTPYGVTLKQLRVPDSTPEYVAFTVTDPDSWREAKARMSPTPDRIDWARLERSYPVWESEGHWITGDFWFGFDVTHSWFVGTETLLIALAEEPDWCREMFWHFLDMNIALFEQILAAGYRLDEINWPDDMGYKQNQFFSLQMYQDLLLPVQKRAIDWAHSHGIRARLHSCGDIRPFVPLLVDAGLDALNPLEVKAGMDPFALKAQYGDRLVLHGGLNAVLFEDTDATIAEIRRLLPVMKENGGYIFSSDHSVPNTVSLEEMAAIIRTAKEYGSYD